MAPMRVRLKVVLAGVMLSTTVVSAQQSVRPGSIKAANAGAQQRLSRDVKAAIHGMAIDSERKPVRNARLRLRNLEMNEIEQTATSDTRGEFSFVARPEIPYVVEIEDASGRMLAVGDVIVAQVGEVAGTVVRLPSRLPAAGGMFRETASSVISAATTAGLTVVDPTLPKVSPSR